MSRDTKYFEEFGRTRAIMFTKWLFDNLLVPNSSYLWFKYDKPLDEVRFFKLEELYDIFISDGDIDNYAAKKESELMSSLFKIINKEP